MEFIHKIILELGVTLVSTIISIVISLKYIVPQIIKSIDYSSSMSSFSFFEGENEDEDEKPTILCASDRQNSIDEDVSMETYNQMNNLMDGFLNREKVLYEYKEYDTHKEIRMGPPIQPGLD